MGDYSFETIGYYSVIDGQLADPVFKTINIEEIQKINRDGIPLDCSQIVPIVRNEDNTGHLLKFLEKEHIFETEPNEKELYIVCLANTLRLLLAYDHRHTEKIDCQFYKYVNTTVIDYVKRNKESLDDEVTFTSKGEIAQILLTSLPDGNCEQYFGSHPLFIVIKHKYVFPGDMTINLFVSKEIHSVIKKNDEIIPIDLKLNVPWCIATSRTIEKFTWKPLILSFLGGGLAHFMAVPIHENYHVDKLIVFDDKTALCDPAVLNKFRALLPRLLLEITRNNSGKVTKRPKLNRNGKYEQNIYISIGEGEEYLYCKTVSTSVEYISRVNVTPTEHELVILGSYKPPIPFPNQLFNADFVKMDNFCKGIYTGLLQEPSTIEFYGTAEEYEKLQVYMDKKQLAMLSFVENQVY